MKFYSIPKIKQTIQVLPRKWKGPITKLCSIEVISKFIPHILKLVFTDKSMDIFLVKKEYGVNGTKEKLPHSGVWSGVCASNGLWLRLYFLGGLLE